jgi:hypothetical protein
LATAIYPGAHMNFDTLVSNDDHITGIIQAKNDKKMTTLPGFFSKKYLKSIVNYLELFPEDDISVSFVVDDNRVSSLLLFRPNEKKNIFVGMAGKTEKES